MKTRYRLIRRGNRGGAYYCVDTQTSKRTSLGTNSEDSARQVVEAKNQAERQPEINLQIAKAYLAATDESFVKRTWREVMAAFVKTNTGSNRTRSERAVVDKAFDSIRDMQLLETPPEHFLKILQSREVSTNNYLRRFHNFAVDMGWLPWPAMPKRQWPAIWDRTTSYVAGSSSGIRADSAPSRHPQRVERVCCESQIQKCVSGASNKEDRAAYHGLVGSAFQWNAAVQNRRCALEGCSDQDRI